jgi:hypothetical protein
MMRSTRWIMLTSKIMGIKHIVGKKCWLGYSVWYRWVFIPPKYDWET